MLTKTSVSAIRALMVLAGQDFEGPASPRRLAEMLGESPTYLAKTLRHLVKAGILRSEHGAKGGVTLGRLPANIRLLDVVEACQGTILGDYCAPVASRRTVCAFHLASLELHEAITGVLAKWTLAALLENSSSRHGTCLMGRVPAPVMISGVLGRGGMV